MCEFCKDNIEDILAVTPMQAGMLFYYLKEPESKVYFDQHCYQLKGRIEIDSLKRAWKYVVRNNEMLRTVFRWNGLNHPIQVILKEYEILFFEYDYSALEVADKLMQLDTLLRLDQKNPIELEKKAYRVIFCKFSKEEYYMIVSAHHIIYDGWSNSLILKELLYAYEDYLIGREPAIIWKTKYKELVKWYQNQDKRKHSHFWENYLKEYNPKRLLKFNNPCVQTSEPGKFLCQVDNELECAIINFIRREHITLATFIYTSWGILLHNYSGYEDILFGVTMSGRTSDIAGVESIVGLFVNSLPLRLNIGNENRVRDLIREVKRTMISFEEFQGTSLIDLKRYVQIGKGASLFDTLVVVQNYPIDFIMVDNEQSICIDFKSSYYMTNFDLSLDVRTFKGIQLAFNFNRDVLNLISIERICKQLFKIFELIINSQDNKVKDFELDDINERINMLKDIEQTINFLTQLEEDNLDEVF